MIDEGRRCPLEVHQPYRAVRPDHHIIQREIVVREDERRVEVVSRQPRLGRVNYLGERIKVAEAGAVAPELGVVGVARYRSSRSVRRRGREPAPQRGPQAGRVEVVACAQIDP